MFQIEFHENLLDDLEKLPFEVFKEADEYLSDKFKQDPYKYTQELHGNLKGYRKTYISNATYRIVSKIIDNKVQIVQIVAIGERKDLEVYKEAYRRLHMIKLAADGQKRNISNFIEYATTQYLTSSQYIENSEMNEIIKDEELVKNLKSGIDDLNNGNYTIV